MKLSLKKGIVSIGGTNWDTKKDETAVWMPEVYIVIKTKGKYSADAIRTYRKGQITKCYKEVLYMNNSS